MVLMTTTAPKTFSTNPGWYTDGLPDGIPTETLEQIYDEAREAYFRAGGHNFAFQMMRVMNNVEWEMWQRGFEPHHDSENYVATTWTERS